MLGSYRWEHMGTTILASHSRESAFPLPREMMLVDFSCGAPERTYLPEFDAVSKCVLSWHGESNGRKRKSTSIMNSLKNLKLISATAAVAGAIVFSFANASFTAAIPAEIVIGIGASLGLIGIAISDYSRTNRSLVPLATLLRPIWISHPGNATRDSADKLHKTDRLAA